MKIGRKTHSDCISLSVEEHCERKSGYLNKQYQSEDFN